MEKHGTNSRVATSEQLLTLQYSIGLELAKTKIPFDVAQGLLTNKSRVKRAVRKLAEELGIEFISAHHYERTMLEKYFQEVFDIAIDLSEDVFPERSGFPAYMAVTPQLDEDKILNSLKKKFKMDVCCDKHPIGKNIDRSREQKRQNGLYVFAHCGTDEPDSQHLGKSYNTATKERMVFANVKEYLLMTGFHKFTKDYFMDERLWTRTSSFWSGGSLVECRWSDVHQELDVSLNFVDVDDFDGGPREIVF